MRHSSVTSTKKRKNAVEDFQLIEKLESNTCLTEKDREVVLYLLSSIKLPFEDINYAIIFLLSVVAVIAYVILTFLK